MDPYLEDPTVWEEFHHVFITECMYHLSDRLPDGYLAKIDANTTLDGNQAFIEIRRVPDHNLVTSLELLCPWNKSGDGVAVHRAKRRNLLAHGVDMVEIDLLTCGQRTELAHSLPPANYYVCVFRAGRKPDVEVYSWGVRQSLPQVSVPLRAPDPDVTVELSAVVTTSYDRGRYARKLRYGQALTASLAQSDVAWAAELAEGASR